MRRLVYLIAIAIYVPLACPAETSQYSRTCVGLDIAATAPSEQLLDLICETVSDQIALLNACGIVQKRPVTIEAVPVIENVPPNCVGVYHCATDEIQVVLPETLAFRDPPDFLYRGLSTDVAFSSILRHELTHALLEHMTEDRPIHPAAHEYIAFALQIEAMSDDERAIFLETNGRRPAKSLDTFNMFIYGLVPGRFASAAWLHFNSPGHGCDFIQDILEGGVVLGGTHLLP